MKSEREKMLSGELYDASDGELDEARVRARILCGRLGEVGDKERFGVVGELFGYETDCYVTPPFFCDYGVNIKVGSGVYFNFNCVVADVCEVSIGDRVLFGPAVQIYGAGHPLDAVERAGGLEFGKRVVIGDDVWVGGAAVICPGVTIGNRVVVGAGAVVTKDFGDDVVIAGNPARVIRRLAD